MLCVPLHPCRTRSHVCPSLGPGEAVGGRHTMLSNTQSADTNFFKPKVKCSGVCSPGSTRQCWTAPSGELGRHEALALAISLRDPGEDTSKAAASVHSTPGRPRCLQAERLGQTGIRNAAEGILTFRQDTKHAVSQGHFGNQQDKQIM